MRAQARDDLGVAAECLLAARGFRATDNDEQTARAYVGAIAEVEAFENAKLLRQMVGAVLKGLARGK